MPSQPDQYFEAKNKIMIIGAETRGWDVQGESHYSNLKDYIDRSIAKQKNFFEKQLSLKNTDKITFHDFTRAVSEKEWK